MNELDKIVIVKEGHGYTTYINDVHCGWGDLEDTLEVFLDYDTEEKIMKYVQRTIESDKRDDVFSSGVKNGRIK